jgi:hypothetical protein
MISTLLIPQEIQRGHLDRLRATLRVGERSLPAGFNAEPTRVMTRE